MEKAPATTASHGLILSEVKSFMYSLSCFDIQINT